MALTEADMVLMLRAAMDKQSITDPQLRAGIAAIAMGESGFAMKPELGYAHTANARIRSIFGSRVAGLTDDDLNALKADPVAFFNRVYGGTFGVIQLGNRQDGDGFKFRGRGLFQLTGRSNYGYIGARIGVDLLTDPEVADQPEVACAIAVAYMAWRYHGGGWAGMKRAVGNNIADVEATKDRLYAQYEQSGEFSAAPVVSSITGVQLVGSPSAVDRVKAVQTILKDAGFYTGSIDGDFGGQSVVAMGKLASAARAAPGG